MAMAAKTWTGKWWELGGGGTVWDSIVYDPGLKLVYLGVGNGGPWVQAYRSPGGGDKAARGKAKGVMRPPLKTCGRCINGEKKSPGAAGACGINGAGLSQILSNSHLSKRMKTRAACETLL